MCKMWWMSDELVRANLLGSRQRRATLEDSRTLEAGQQMHPDQPKVPSSVKISVPPGAAFAVITAAYPVQSFFVAGWELPGMLPPLAAPTLRC